MPANFSINGPAGFQNKVIRDLYLLSTTPSGAALINQLGASGKPIRFVPESDPQNSFCTPDNGTNAQNGTGTGSTISYNPDVRMNVYDRSGNVIGQPSQVILAHEMAHGLANAQGTQQTGTDPAGPASEPNIDREESQAIGTGSHTTQTPSENSVRRDLGLPERDNHFRTPDGPAQAVPPTNLRPGGY